MADADPRITTAPSVTTGPIRGSRKIHVGPLKVAMRAIDLEPSAGEPPLNVYDPSGPYTDPAVTIDINAGLAELRRDWIRDRGDVEEVAARESRPEDNGQLSLAEFTRLATATPPRVDVSATMNRLDLNRDQKITLIENRTATLANFDKLDTDKDGVVSVAEMRAGGIGK